MLWFLAGLLLLIAFEELAPQFRGFSYIAVDEVIAVVEGGTRKIVIVIPRWRRQENKVRG